MNRRQFMNQLANGTVSATAFGTSLSASAADYLLHTSNAGELASHTIADISYTDIQLKWPRFVGKNGRRDIHGYGPKVGVCVLTTDQGVKAGACTGAEMPKPSLI